MDWSHISSYNFLYLKYKLSYSCVFGLNKIDSFLKFESFSIYWSTLIKEYSWIFNKFIMWLIMKFFPDPDDPLGFLLN